MNTVTFTVYCITLTKQLIDEQFQGQPRAWRAISQLIDEHGGEPGSVSHAQRFLRYKMTFKQQENCSQCLPAFVWRLMLIHLLCKVLCHRLTPSLSNP